MHVDDDISGNLSDPTATAAAEVRRERAEAPQLPLRVLAALLNADGDDDPFAVIFDSLQDVLAFDQALVLEEGETAWNCVAALPPALAELVWRPAHSSRRSHAAGYRSEA
jgi:hypothetical protein